jgi:hypothetical protein
MIIYYLKRIWLVAIVMYLLLPINVMQAQSDSCTAPPFIAVNLSCINTNFNISAFNYSDAVTEAPLPSCGIAFRDGWYRFTTDATTTFVSIHGVTNREIGLAVYSGACGGLTEIDCTIPEADTADLDVTLLPNTTYFLRIMRTNNSSGNTMNGTICITKKIPVNDNCSGAIVLGANTDQTCVSPIAGTTANATQSMPGCSGTADDDVWYSFVAIGTSHIITTTPDTLYDPVMEVFSGNCGALTSLGCVDFSIGPNAESTFLTGLTIGAMYFVRVYSWSNISTGNGTFTICITSPPTIPLNNDCSGAFPLTINHTEICRASTLGTTIAADESMPGCSGIADDDVWYSFVASDAAHTITLTSISLTNGVIQAFGGACGAWVDLGCTDNSLGSGPEMATLTGLTIGSTYYVRVYSASGSIVDSGSFRICVTTSCAVGSSVGTTTLGCPSVRAGGVGLNGADPPNIDCLSSGCVDLEANYLQLGETTDYTVNSIPFEQPYQFGCLANLISVNNDDVWSPIIDLPFDFCFYGNTYNKCVVSSNGAISFDMVNNIPGGYSNWSFASNIPNAALFKNAIFGVYMDIDPRFGGTIGWELITLNTGCRALVASWIDLPMYACTSTLYTGMMVLYENTNIIDIYVQEKNLCTNWNGSNAIIGLQNATATAGIVAPGRNGLSTDWTSVNEAWRFIPSGTPITTVNWYEGSGTAGPIVGTNDTINICPTATTIYTAEVSYNLCNGTVLKVTDETTVTVEGNKVWNGSINSDWDTDNNWTPTGVPTDTDCVVIPDVTNDPVISGTGYDAFGYSLKILPDGFLTLESDNNLTLTNVLKVHPAGTFNIRNNASLIQIDETQNSGNINMERITTPLYRFDYTYWNSPVTFSSNYTLGNLSPNTMIDKYYHWTPSLSNGTGNWAQESAATVMDPKKGYIIRAPNDFSYTPTVFTPYTANFIGTPNNGIISCPISYGTLGNTSLNDKWNLIGNPYPSALDALAFVNEPANRNVIDGTLYFWTHNSPISASFPDPFYNDFTLNYTMSDYAIWNNTGATAAASGGLAPQQYIAAGQAFFVQSNAVPGDAVFTNNMRVQNNNRQFFRAGQSEGDIERHRIWLNLTNNSGAFNQLLVGYIENATSGFDRGLDGMQLSQNAVSFYSVAGDRELAIQARPLPFNIEDRVPLGYRSNLNGTFSIQIDHYDALFGTQNIYIEDGLLNVIHDLKTGPYTFTTAPGSFANRFVLRYTDALLGVANPQVVSDVTAFIKDRRLFARAGVPMISISVYEVTGQLVKEYVLAKGSMEFNGEFPFSEGVYFAKIKLGNGITVTRKIMN